MGSGFQPVNCDAEEMCVYEYYVCMYMYVYVCMYGLHSITSPTTND